ncbi:hypothetical protein EIN_149990 [Entamoeba invadens IP1]|uniref:Uncharacterized protein n=1 Tax=Entamoeba invadens IP1 TaxID=370355 RepID=A0A0A1U8K0_ENTIV|nr:hypothetical protein EIN_149990 [Entamoeba invadens IP1]ELP91172.1 hypothetical protein EIN_149990 [Entamoeba invadens IP1]|eukprot:XP_004257943.1 hypothetical protein EIN_149990 [Entamoeba invadens IP1]
MSLSKGYGVTEEVRERFIELLAYYKRFWIEKIGTKRWSQFFVENRTKNFCEGFHNGVGLSFQIAHPSYLLGKFETQVMYLDEIAKMNMEYNFKTKASRHNISNTAITRSKELLNEMNKLIEKQKDVVFDENGSSPSTFDSTLPNKQSELEFDTTISYVNEYESLSSKTLSKIMKNDDDSEFSTRNETPTIIQDEIELNEFNKTDTKIRVTRKLAKEKTKVKKNFQL